MLNPVAACSLCSSSISLDTYKAFAQVLERSEGQRIEGEHKIDCDKQRQIRCTPSSNTTYPKLAGQHEPRAYSENCHGLSWKATEMLLAVSTAPASQGSQIPLPVYQCSQAERLIESAS